jgi:hypothetical protein
VNSPARIDPQYAAWARQNYGPIRGYFGARAKRWEDCVDLYLMDLQRQQAPQQAYEAGVREGATVRTHRQRRGATAAITSGGQPATRRLGMSTPNTIEEAFAQAQQLHSRRR